MLINKAALYVSEASTVLNVPTSEIYRLIHTGQLPAYKPLGRRAWHIPESSINNYMENRIKESVKEQILTTQ